MADERHHNRRPTLDELRDNPAALVRYLRSTLLVASQEQMAHILDVSTWSIGHWERGSRVPNARHMRRLLDVYHTETVALRQREKRERGE